LPPHLPKLWKKDWLGRGRWEHLLGSINELQAKSIGGQLAVLN